MSYKLQNLSQKLYELLYLIRASENKIIELYHENEMKTPMHMSKGEEAIAAGICLALRDDDQIFGTYRSHAFYLSKTLDIDGFFAELYGKETGHGKGKAGSMHLINMAKGFMYSSAIVAASIPGAVGSAFANKFLDNSKVVCVFFGDGAIDEGCFWESLNFACLMSLPIVFVCEDNNLAVHTPSSKRHGYRSICEIIKSFNCNVLSSATTDVESVHNIAKKAIEEARQNKPCFLYLKYYRYLEHVGINYDFDSNYRPVSEFYKWREKDPVAIQRKRLLETMSLQEIIEIESSIDREIDSSILRAKKDKFASIEELMKDVL